MHMHPVRWTGLGVLVALLSAVAEAGCSAEDDSSSGGCTATACTAHCRSIGRANGTCADNLCTCEGALPDGGGDTVYDADYGGDVSGRTTRVTGKVWSPGGVVPISGALVYFSLVEPPAIPPGAYPETCVDPPTPFFVRSAPDGTFAIDVVSGTYRFVVQKGQFRRIRDYTVPATGPVEVPIELTTLPSRNDVGDTIPHMALVFALEGGDHIEDVLAKVQMGDVGSDNRLIRGTEQFDIYNIAPYEPNTALLTSLDRMLEYHILFFPCTVYFGYDEQLNDPTGPLSDPAVLENLRAFARAGGKIYATDMMYDVFEQPMPVYVDICGDDAVLNDGDQTAWADSRTMSGWVSNGQSVDTDLSAWLDATGIGSTGMQFRQNFVWIDGLYDSPDPGPDGPFPPKVWVTGDFILDPGRTLPLTVTFPYGAGKVLFSTYHTVGDEGGSPGHPDIYPQEYVLLYLIMEIGVCQDPLL
jgi:hypothetical protein